MRSFAALFLLLACTFARAEEPPLTRIAFGSCNRPWRENRLWEPILSDQPQLWIWLGDIVYGNADMANLAHLYAWQKSKPEYQKLHETCRVIGVWDDNDYGESDGGADFPKKVESQKLLLDFLDESADSPRRTQRGVYASYTFGPSSKSVKVVLLDTRYFRGKPGVDSDILGEEQWRWLEQQLAGSSAQIHLIGSGTEVIACEHLFEKWGDYPKARQRLFDLLAKTKPRCPIILSGDRHLGEISCIEIAGFPSPLYDITSSGMTHFAAPALQNFFYDFDKEPNRYRSGNLFCGYNFGLLTIDWTQSPPRITAQIRDAENTVRCEAVIQQK